MPLYTFGGSIYAAVTDAAGNRVPNWPLRVYASDTSTTSLTGLVEADSVTPIAELRSNPTGSADPGGIRLYRVPDRTAVFYGYTDPQGREVRLFEVAREVTSLFTVQADAAQANTSASNAAASATAAQTSADAAASSLAASRNEIAPAVADLAAYQIQTPTLEELVSDTVIDTQPVNNVPVTTVGINILRTIRVAPIPMRVLSVGLAWEYWALPANDVDYWEMQVVRVDAAGVLQTIGTRTTQAIGANANQGITSRKAWTFNALTLSATVIGAGEIVAVYALRRGAPPNMLLPLTVTMRAVPA